MSLFKDAHSGARVTSAKPGKLASTSGHRNRLVNHLSDRFWLPAKDRYGQ